jgi:hypothetical protein
LRSFLCYKKHNFYMWIFYVGFFKNFTSNSCLKNSFQLFLWCQYFSKIKRLILWCECLKNCVILFKISRSNSWSGKVGY